MRIRRVLLLAGLAATASAIFAAAAFGSKALPGASYPWTQPGSAAPATCCTQPSFPFVAPGMTSPAAGSDYMWEQPGTAPVTTPFAQPPGT